MHDLHDLHDLRDLLAEEALRRQPATPPPFEAVLTRLRRRRHRQWLAAAVSAVAVLAVVVSVGTLVTGGRAEVATPSTPVPLVEYVGDGLAFRFPGTWAQTSYDIPLHGGVVVLSTAIVTDPCVTASDAQGISVTCSAPTATLLTAGVLVTWSRVANGSAAPDPTTRFDRLPGERTTVAGYPAKARAGSPDGPCSSSGGSRQIDVSLLVTRSTGDEIFIMTACLAEPTAPGEQDVQAMLDSVSFA